MNNKFDLPLMIICIAALILSATYVAHIVTDKEKAQETETVEISQFAQIKENLFYDIETNVVYYISDEISTPYFASNGLPYAYIDGELTEIKRIEKSVKVIEINTNTVKEVEKTTASKPKTTVTNTTKTEQKSVEQPQADGVLTKSKGVNWYQGHKETYYNLDMSRIVQNAQSKGIVGDYWVREDGCKMLGSYIMVAANYSVHPYGSTVATSLGTGIVVDTGGFANSNPQGIDIACAW